MSDEDQDLWARLCEMPRPSKVVDFPRKGPDGEPVGKLAIWVLTQEEQSAAAAAAQNLTTKLVKESPKRGDVSQGYDDVYANVAAAELLFRACRKAGDITKPAFPSTEQLRTKFTVDEVGALLNHYYTVQSDLGPIVAQLSKEELDALVERIATSGERFPLDLLSPALLRSLAFSLACQLHASRTASSSPGSQPASEASAQKSDDAPLAGDPVAEAEKMADEMIAKE